MLLESQNRAAGDSPASGKCDCTLFATAPEITTSQLVAQPPPSTYLKRGPGSWQHIAVVAERVTSRLVVEDAP